MRASAGSHRTFLYVRVSTYDQAEYGTSLDGQRDLGTKFCAEQGYADPQVRVEVESAGEEKIERRKELKRILSEIRSGDVLVCRDLSRWSRDQVFAVHSVRQMRAKGVTVRFYTQPFLDYVSGAPIDRSPSLLRSCRPRNPRLRSARSAGPEETKWRATIP
jgi:DNA invertase Pin-like site-specific DNA recombinase